ncbi:MAG: M23 family metallopeptidase [Acidimicrobiales bacterium]
MITRPVCSVLLSVLLVASAPAPPAAAREVVFRPPSSASVLDPFRPPAGPYGAGNRGIEYDTAPGDPITAAADGRVAFVGAVAGNLFVSVDHPGELRSTYGFVGRTLVRVGQAVRVGDLVAIAGGPFHFTVRLRGTYVDPAGLFGVRRLRVTLVPHHRPESPPGTGYRPWWELGFVASGPTPSGRYTARRPMRASDGTTGVPANTHP